MKSFLNSIRQNPYSYASLALIMIFGAIARLYDLSSYAFPADDACNLAVQSSSGFKDLWHYIITEVHPPIGHFWGWTIRKFTDDPLTLRFFISFVPGMFAIVIIFELGRRLSGNFAGLLLALITSFGYATLHLSEVIRNYIIFFCLLNLMLIYIFDYLKTGEDRSRYIYYLLALLAVFTNYSGTLVLFGLTLYVAFRFLQDNRYRIDVALFKKTALWVIPNIIIAALIAWFFFAQKPYLQHRYLDYCPSSFPSGITGFIKTFYMMETFFTSGGSIRIGIHVQDENFWHGLVGMLGAAIAVSGFVFLFFRNEWKILILCSGMIALNIALSAARIYPVTSCRHALFLMPFMFIPAAFLAQYIVEKIRVKIEPEEKGERHKLYFGALILVGILCFAWLSNIAKNDYNRFWMELPRTFKEEEELRGYLKAKVEPGDIVITDGLQAFTFEYKVGISNNKKLSDHVWNIKYEGMDIYYDRSKIWPVWANFGDAADFYRELPGHVDLSRTGKIWFVKFGPLWQMSITGPAFNAAGEYEGLNSKVIDKFTGPGGVVYSVGTNDWLEFLKAKGL